MHNFPTERQTDEQLKYYPIQ